MTNQKDQAVEMALNMLINGEFKQCNKCKQVKPLDYFYKDHSKKKNVYTKAECKECYAERRRVSRPSYYTNKGSLLAVDDREYTDADLTLHNYKEPLTKVPDGYGYMGTVTSTNDGKYIQCHLCGKLYANLGGHLYAAHKMLAREYKDQFGLEQSSALISEQERMHLKTKSLEYLKTLTEEEKEEYSRKAREAYFENVKNRKTTRGKKEKLETKNKKGSCPDQVLAKLREVAEDLGHTPSKSEFITHQKSQRYVHLVYKLFGDWPTAIELAGLKNKSRKLQDNYRAMNDGELLEMLRDFVIRNGERPTKTDFNREVLPSLALYVERFGSLELALRESEAITFLSSNERKIL